MAHRQILLAALRGHDPVVVNGLIQQCAGSRIELLGLVQGQRALGSDGTVERQRVVLDRDKLGQVRGFTVELVCAAATRR